MGGLVRANYCLGRYEETYRAAGANWTGRGQPEAVAALERGYAEGGFEEHDANMPYLGVWGPYRSLRDEPRFQELLRRMNLPAS